MINTVILEVWNVYIQIQLYYLLPECPWASYVTSHPLLSHLKMGENVAGERDASVQDGVQGSGFTLLPEQLKNGQCLWNNNVQDIEHKNRNIRKVGVKGRKP